MTWPPLLAGAGIVVLAACLAGFAPQRLLRPLRDDAARPRPGLRLAGASGALGLLVLGAASLTLPWPTAVAIAVLATVLAAMAVVDGVHHVIPDLHVVLIAVVGLAGPLAPHWTYALAGAVLGGLLLGGVRHVYGRVRGLEGLGLGDVKLAMALGAVAGPRDILWIIIAAAGLGLAYGVVRGMSRTPAIPFGTAMALPALAAAAIARWPS
ncbi:MAG: A24 family peptidase [Pseudomonadota bacterium]